MSQRDSACARARVFFLMPERAWTLPECARLSLALAGSVMVNIPKH